MESEDWITSIRPGLKTPEIRYLELHAVVNIFCSQFVERLWGRANDPTEGKDILIVDAYELSDGGFDELVSKAAELRVPFLVRNYASRFGPLGRKEKTSDIITYLAYQHGQGRPPPTCQVQGPAEEHHDYDFLIEYFKSHPDLREVILNLLDNPAECDPTLTAAIEVPDDIVARDVIDFGIERPAESNLLRMGVKIRGQQ